MAELIQLIKEIAITDTKYSFSLDRQKIQLTDLTTLETKEYEITADTQEVVSNYVF